MFERRVIKAFFALLRSGLWNTEIDELSCFPLADSEWEELFEIAKSQTVEGVVYDGIQKLTSELFPKRDILLKWVVIVSNIEQKNESMKVCIDEQDSFFNKIGIEAILLKGQGIAQFYSSNTHRVCGDIDWYFKNKDDNRILLKELQKRKVKTYKSTVNNLDFRWKSFEVDIHVKLFDIFNPIARRRLNKIKNRQLLSNGVNIVPGNSYNTLPPNLNIIQVNLHILKHLLLFGIGMRQFCDSAVLYNKLHGLYESHSLEDIYRSIKIINWIHVLHHFLVKYIGLSEDKLPFPLVEGISSDWLMEDIISTGNFGFYDHEHADIKADKVIVRKQRGKKLWASFKQYFPLAPYEALCYPVMHVIGKLKLKAFE